MKKKGKIALNILSGIDWGILKEQKVLLYKTISYLEMIDAKDQAACIEGLLSLLDEIQDFAVDVLKIDEDEVFKYNV